MFWVGLIMRLVLIAVLAAFANINCLGFTVIWFVLSEILFLCKTFTTFLTGEGEAEMLVSDVVI